MGWDLWLAADTGGEELASIEGCDWNYTYNTSPMLYDAGIDLKKYCGKTCEEVIDELETSIKILKDNPEKYEAMNPENGWGSYEGVTRKMELLLTAFKEHPKAIIQGWF